jgi:uncharacterized protein
MEHKSQTLGQIKYFLMYTFAITWSCWLLIIFCNNYFKTLNYGEPLFWLPYTIGSLGPAVSAYLVFKKFRQFFAQKTFLNYIFGELIQPKIWAIFGIFFIWRFFMIWVSFGIIEPISILSFLINIPFLIILGGLEELGWRGILQPRLEKIITFLPSVLVVGIIWSIWHLPLWFMKGSSQSAFPFGLYLLSGIVLTTSLTTLYKYTNNLFLCVLSHVWFNACIGFALFVGKNGQIQLKMNWKVFLVFSIEFIVPVILGIIYNRKNKD